MMMPGFGLGELIVSFFVAVFALGVPLGILLLLFKIYTKLKNIEEQVKKN